MSEILPLIVNIAFLVLVTGFALVLALCIYIYVRYGRTRGVTIPSSLLVIAFFMMAVITAYASLQNLMSLAA